MEEIRIENLRVEPYFDMEDFMNFSKENRIDGEVFEKLANMWDNWLDRLKVLNLHCAGNSWLVVCLPEEIEKTIDSAWDESPGQGYMLHNLAQLMCMSTIQELLPQAANGGCAPSPAMTDDFKKTLAAAGLVNEEKTGLNRRYAVLTYYPFRGGCEVCSLREECPKGNGMPDMPSVVLPGYEKGKN